MKKMGSMCVLLIFLTTTYADDRIISVAKSGGDFTNLIAAINSITDASQSKPYKIVMGPGEFNLGFGKQLRMKPFVSVEGAGTEMTTIRGTVKGKTKGLIKVAENTELSHLRVSNSVRLATSSQLTGIYIGNPSTSVYSPASIRHVDVTAYSSGIIVVNNNVNLEHVRIGTGQTAFQAFNSTVQMSDVSLYAARSEFGQAPLVIGGTFLKLIKSDATLKDVLFSNGNIEIGPRHISASDGSNVTIKNSEIQATSFNGFSTANDATSKITIINSALGAIPLNPNPGLNCIRSFLYTTGEALDNACLN